jgi:hypothetical protein
MQKYISHVTQELGLNKTWRMCFGKTFNVSLSLFLSVSVSAVRKRTQRMGDSFGYHCMEDVHISLSAFNKQTESYKITSSLTVRDKWKRNYRFLFYTGKFTGWMDKLPVILHSLLLWWKMFSRINWNWEIYNKESGSTKDPLGALCHIGSMWLPEWFCFK